MGVINNEAHWIMKIHTRAKRISTVIRVYRSWSKERMQLASSLMTWVKIRSCLVWLLKKLKEEGTLMSKSQNTNRNSTTSRKDYVLSNNQLMTLALVKLKCRKFMMILWMKGIWHFIINELGSGSIWEDWVSMKVSKSRFVYRAKLQKRFYRKMKNRI